MRIPKTYAAKYSNAMNKKNRVNPKGSNTFSGKGGSTSKFGGNKRKVSRSK